MPGKRFEGDLDDYKDTYLTCRGRRNHVWDIETDFNVTTNRNGRIVEFKQKLTCPRCTCTATDTYEVTRAGRLKRKGQRQYDYADGYQMRRGVKVPLEEAREALVMRELSRSLDAELMARLRGMRPDARKAAGPKLRIVGAA